jgi:GNAT superfamily N-acetyltransferase
MSAPIRIQDDPRPGDLEALEREIDDFNVAATGFRDGRRLAAFVHDPDGALRAGIAGHTWGGCCEIKFLWVREDARRAGLGSALLAAAEREAAARGCERVVLATHSFQAPAFYPRQGYRECGRAEGYPHGHAQHYFTKRLGG